MDNFQETSTIKEFTQRLPGILPEFDHGKFVGKLLELPFAHSDARVDFSPADLRQRLPGEVFKLSYQECPKECAEHEEKLRRIVRERFDQIANERKRALKLYFRQGFIRKKIFSNNMSVEETTRDASSRCSGVQVNFRNQCMLNDIDKFAEILERLGAVKKREERKMDILVIQFIDRRFHDNYHVYLDPSTMLLYKLTQRAHTGKMCNIIFPTPPNHTEKIFDGITLNPRKQQTIKFKELCDMCSDASLLSMLKTPGLGIFSKLENPERFVIHESNINLVGHLFLRHNRVDYSFDLDGVEVILRNTSGVNHSFEENERETKVHQRLRNDPGLKFRCNRDLSIDGIVAVITRVIVAIKNAIQAGELRLTMYDIVEQLNNRFRNAVHYSPKWCATGLLENARPFEASIMVDLRRMRDGRSLEEILDVSPGIHAIPLRAAVRSSLRKIDEVRRWSPDLLQKNGLHPEGRDLTELRQKLLDAAAERNLTV